MLKVVIDTLNFYILRMGALNFLRKKKLDNHLYRSAAVTHKIPVL